MLRKRKRSESTSPARGKKSDEYEDRNFSYEFYRRQLRWIYDKLNINENDFWLFLRKVEALKKSQGKPISPDDKTKKSYCVTCKLNVTEIPLSEQVSKQLTIERLKNFVSIVELYIDFTQKEKFNKLIKLRKCQKELPISAYEDIIIEKIKKERVVIIAGDTGCGKSTQVPRYLLKCGFTKIACTQPRRIACTSLAKRLAFETLNVHNNKIGYQVRFQREKNTSTEVLFLTEGLLLRQLSTDMTLSNYEIVVLDEVHERHLHGDFLLGVLKCLLFKKQDFKLVLMSATINLNLFVGFFGGNTEVIQVPGRLYPVNLYYRPISAIEERKGQLKSKSSSIDAGPYLQIIQLIDNKYPANERGDVLIFLSGISEITKVVDVIKEYNIQQKRWIVLPLHSSLSLAEQDRVFDYAPDGVRKCIVSTNIAETSVTIDGIRFVIDSGKVKQMCYDPIEKLQTLKEYWVSAASAEQRKGRAGRTGPGVCFRVYSQEDYDCFEPYSSPEIERVSLESLLLQMISMGLPNCRKFPFIETPNPEKIENTLVSLKLQGVLTYEERITPIGTMLSNLPIEISLGKMLIISSILQQDGTIIPLVASLSVQTPFTNRAYRDLNCERVWKEFESDHGDPITLLKLYYEWLKLKKEKGNSRQWCSKAGLEEQRFYEITKLNRQFKDLLKDSGMLSKSENKPLTKTERSLRHGEVKLLQSAKRDYTRSKAGKSRKVLKLDVWEISNENEDEDIDIKDVEFQLTNDKNKVNVWLEGLNISSSKQVIVAKFIICAGLYPQFAIPDEFNESKTALEQLYHTQKKPYIFLHPNSYFSNNPDCLKIDEPNILYPNTKTKYEKRALFSTKHQTLCYVNILETTKTYLTNSIRAPALQTFLLFSTNIETNINLSRIICDEWVMFDILNPVQAELLLIKCIKLRQTLSVMLEQKLNGKTLASTTSMFSEEQFIDDVINFQLIEVAYSMKRLLPADLKYLYIKNNFCVENMNSNPFVEHFTMIPNLEKGGVKVAEYLTYNCVISPEDLDINQCFKCVTCKLDLSCNTIERLQHSRVCTNTTEIVYSDKNANNYHCDICKKDYSFTSVQILKHKKQH